MRERTKTNDEVIEAADQLVDSLRKENGWKKLSYRYVCLLCKVSLRYAQSIIIQIRTNQHVNYYFVDTKAKVPTIMCRYSEELQQIEENKFSQFTHAEFEWIYNKFNNTNTYKNVMLTMIFIEQLYLNHLAEEWRVIMPGYYANLLSISLPDLEHMLSTLEEKHIIKRLGITRMYRLALSDEMYSTIENSAYAQQQQEIVEKSKQVIEDTPTPISDTFKVLTELNFVADATHNMIGNCYEINASIIKQQMELAKQTKILEVLREKETVYANSMVCIDAIMKNYENMTQEVENLRNANKKLRLLEKETEKYNNQRRANDTQHLETMLSSILTTLEEYFSLPMYEKNKVISTNRTKTQITRIVMETIDNIQKGKDII